MNNESYLIIGYPGQLASEFEKELTRRNCSVVVSGLEDCDITREDQVRARIDAVKPTVVINCAAYNFVDDAEQNRNIAFKVNAEAVELLATVCREKGLRFVHYSSDYVFDGRKGALYTEDDEPNPLNVYGKSKLAGEQAALRVCPQSLVFRTSWVFGAGQQNFLYKVSQWMIKNPVLKIAADEASVPTYTGHIVCTTLAALDQGLSGLYHLTSSGYASRYELARYFLETIGADNLIIPVPMSVFNPKVERPLFACMSNQKLIADLGLLIPHWRDGVEQYIETVYRGQ